MPKSYWLLTCFRLWGNPADLDAMARALRQKHPEETFHLLVAKSNSENFTYDGVDLGGERVCREIEHEVEKLTHDGRRIEKLSVVGYSFGGLVARYAVGLLEGKGFFEKIEPIVGDSHSRNAIEFVFLNYIELYHFCNSALGGKNATPRLAQKTLEPSCSPNPVSIWPAAVHGR